MLRCGIALTTVLAGLTLTVPRSATAAVDAAKLRQAIPLPSVSFTFGYQATEGLVISNNEQDRAVQLAALKKPLTDSVEEADRWYRLGCFYYQTKDIAASKLAYAQALTLYRTQTQKHPKDEVLLVEYGVALDAASEPKQAETVLRRAVLLAPLDAKAWAALGQALTDQAFPALLTPEQQQKGLGDLNIFGLSPEQTAAMGEQFKGYKPAPEQVKQAQQFLEEAKRCFDKAILVQPKAHIGYVYRAGFRIYGQELLHILTNVLPKENVTLVAAVQKFQASLALNMVNNSGVTADMQQAARIAPDDLPTVASAAMFEALSVISHFNDKHGPGQELVWDAVPPESRQFVEQDAALLEHIAQDKNAAIAVQAADAAGIIWVFTNRYQNAERDFRIAVARDAHRQDAWDALIGLVIQDKRYGEAAVLAQQRIKTIDDVHTRMILAKIDDKLDQPAQASAQVMAALKDAPDDLTANLAQAVLFLRHSDDDAQLKEAREQLDRAGVIYQKAQTTDNWKNYTTIVSAYNALIGNEAQARQGLNQVLAADKDNKEAKQVLAALGPVEPVK